jgi:hypothetical protein
MNTTERKPSNNRPRVSPELLDLMPPSDPAMERQLLGSVIADPTKLDEVSCIVKRDSFYEERHQRLWEHLENMPAHVAQDNSLLTRWLAGVADLEACGGAAYLAEVVQSVPYAANAVYYAEIIRDLAVKRRIREQAEGLLQLSMNPTVSADSLRAEWEAMGEMMPAISNTSFPIYSCSVLIGEKFDIQYWIDGVMVANEPMGIIGPPKALKTSTALDMAFSIATGGYFFGRFRCPQAVPVGFFSAESGLPTLAETLRRIGRAAGTDPATVQNLMICDRVPQFGTPEHLIELKLMIRRYGWKVIFVDPIFMALDGGDIANVFIQGQLYRRVSELCQHEGCTLVMLHHAKKGLGSDCQPLDLSAAAGAGFVEMMRQWIFLSKRESYILGSGLHKLHFSFGGSHGHNGYFGVDIFEGAYRQGFDRDWQVTVLNPDEIRDSQRDQKTVAREAARQETLETDKRQILNVLFKCPQGETKSIIRDRSGVRSSRFNPALASLLEDGCVIPCDIQKGNRKQPFEGYKIKETSPNV